MGLYKCQSQCQNSYSSNRPGIRVHYPIIAGDTHSIWGERDQQYFCAFEKKLSFLDFTFLPWLQVFPVYPGWHLHLFGPTHSPCLHPGWHTAANRGILIILPLQSWLTALYFETNGNDLTNSIVYVPPFSIIICVKYHC